mmetsp:Transcript_30523/g.97108  ORF Transcript_30523/g.97108 Transcript_30523/m.97108 type:complete len:1323 (+) Transcript_30523:527-4495(+)
MPWSSGPICQGALSVASWTFRWSTWGTMLFETGYSKEQGLFFSGVRYSDCGPQPGSACTSCTPGDVAAGRCSTHDEAWEIHRSHMKSAAFDIFPAAGSLLADLNLTEKVLEGPDTSGVWVHNVDISSGSGTVGRFVPSVCLPPALGEAAPPCLELVSHEPSATMCGLLEATGFPYHAVFPGVALTRTIVEERIAAGKGVVFTYTSPSPWLEKVSAERIAFPIKLSACGDGFGFAIGCDTPRNSLRNGVHPSMRQSAPALYHAMREPMRMSIVQLQEMMKSHVDGGGTYEDNRVVACEWMRAHKAQVKSWLPLHCPTDSQLIINADGSTGCCEGKVRALAPGEPVVCVPSCDSDTEVPNVEHGRCDPLCSPGKVLKNIDGNVTCGLCPAGTAWEAVPDPFLTGRSAICRLCAAGTFSSSPGRVTCSVCFAGTFSLAGGDSCVHCPSGTDPGEPGQLSCPCKRGFFRLGVGRAGQGEDCTPCPGTMKTTAFPSSSSPKDCVCEQGSFAKPVGEVGSNCNGTSGEKGPCLELLGNYTCELCGQGFDCSLGTAEPTQVAGYFIDVKSARAREYTAYICRDALECVGGALGACAPGRTGLACTRCEDAHYPVSNGRCSPCVDGDVVPFIAVSSVSIVALGAMFWLSSVDVAKQRITVVMITAIAGQLAASLQVMGMFNGLNVAWTNPLRGLLQVVALISFDLDIVRFSFIVGVDRPFVSFAFKLILFPIFAVVLFVITMTIRCFKGRTNVDLDRYLNSLGLVLSLLFVTVSLLVLLPFACTPHPSGKSAMASNPGIVCWQGDHIPFAVLGIFGIMAYPVFLLSLVLLVTWRYHARVASGGSMSLLRRYRWLFGRFRPEAYYFGSIFLVRSVLIPLVPVIFPGMQMEQILMLGMVLLAVLSGFMFATIVGALATFALAGLYALLRYFWSSINYGAFLCHHKAGAGVWARYFKLRLACYTKANIFIDSDNLMELDTLFECVLVSTRHLVVLGTRDVCYRMWCAGEIATAASSAVPITLVLADDWQGLPQDMSLDTVWTQEEVHMLNTFGVDLPRMRQAYRHLRDEAPKICFARLAGVKEPNIVIFGSPSDPEAVSTCLVLRHFINQQIQEEVAIVASSAELWALPGQQPCGPMSAPLVVVLTRGLLREPACAELVSQVYEKDMPFATVLADPCFDFPGADFFSSLPAPHAEAFKALVKVIAVPFSPKASYLLMSCEVEELIRRRKSKILAQVSTPKVITKMMLKAAASVGPRRSGSSIMRKDSEAFSPEMEASLPAVSTSSATSSREGCKSFSVHGNARRRMNDLLVTAVVRKCRFAAPFQYGETRFGG